MPTQYCGECGSANLWTVDKPVTCAKCHKPMSAAFKGAASRPAQVTPRQEVLIPVFDSNVEDEYLDERQKDALKRQLTASLRATPVIILPAASNSVKLDDLINNPGIIDTFVKPTSAPQPPDGSK